MAAPALGSGGELAPRQSRAAAPPTAADPVSASPVLAGVDPAQAWAPYQPSAARPWTRRLAAHLFRRAGFGASWGELERALERGPQATVDGLLDPTGPGTPGPAAIEGEAALAANEAAAARSGDAASLNAWWLRRLLESPQPLREKLVLFWHQHFAVGSPALNDLPLFYRHLEALRARALGGLEDLLGAVLGEAAVYVAHGGEQNRRAQPNQAFARLWLDAFTLGPGVASEDDLRHAARACTGWFVYGHRLRFIEREHDDGEKTVLGRTGRWGRDDLRPILAAHPATARHLAGRLFRWFVSDTASPPAALLEPLAAALQRPDGIRHCVGTLLRSEWFFSEATVAQKIKSPVELAVGLARAFEVVPATLPMARDLAGLGQRLDAPPTVRGWPGGVDWINSIAFAARLRLCRAVLEGTRDYAKALDPWALARAHGRTSASEAMQFWIDLLVPDQLPSATRDALLASARPAGPGPAAWRGVVLDLLSQPEFQLA